MDSSAPARTETGSRFQPDTRGTNAFDDDRSLTARHGDIVIASLEREMTVKQLHLNPPPVQLLACNPAYPPLVISEGMVLEIFGVVTNVVRNLRQ